MRYRFFRNGKWITINSQSSTEPVNIEEYEPVIRMAEIELVNLKARIPDQDTRFYIDPYNQFKILSEFGRDELFILGKGVEEPKKKPEEEDILDFIAYRLYPYLRTPDGNGILLCGDAFNFEGPYTKFDPYERNKACNYPYAPYAFPVTVDNNISSYSVYETLPVLGEDETLLKFMIKPINDNPLNDLPQFVPIIEGYNGAVRYIEPPWNGGGYWAPKYYNEDYEAYNQEWWEWNYEGGSEPFTWMYGFDIESSGEYLEFIDNGNWSWRKTTSITYLGVPFMTVTDTTVAINFDCTWLGEQVYLVSFANASDGSNKWAMIYRKRVHNATGIWSGPLPPGGVFSYYTNDGHNEYRYADYTGIDVLLETQPWTPTFAGGLCKMFEYEGRTIITFSYYGSVYDQANAPRLAGLSENGHVTVTNIRNITDTDENVYNHPYGQNHLGIVAIENRVSLGEEEED